MARNRDGYERGRTAAISGSNGSSGLGLLTLSMIVVKTDAQASINITVSVTPQARPSSREDVPDDSVTVGFHYKHETKRSNTTHDAQRAQDACKWGIVEEPLT